MNGVQGDFQFNWHTIRNPLLDADKSMHEFHFIKENVERAIQDLVHWLQGTTTKYDDDSDDSNDSDDSDDSDDIDDDLILA